MSKLEDDITEIDAFIAQLRFESPISISTNSKSLLKSAYKQFHAMLVWGLIVDTQSGGGSQTKTYFRETLSDISHAFALTLLHLYKPARASLRSGIENLIRSLLLMRNLEMDSINTVYQLFEKAKQQFKAEALIAKNVDQLEMIYGELCKTVHSAKIDYMSLTVPFEGMFTFQNGRYTSNISHLRNVCSAANQAVFWLCHGELRKAGHINEDLVRDSIPRTLKRAAHVLTS